MWFTRLMQWMKPTTFTNVPWDLIEKISFETKLVEGPDGGSIIKSTTNYYIKGDLQIDESKAEEGKEKTSQLFKHIDTYLKNNPNEYN